MPRNAEYAASTLRLRSAVGVVRGGLGVAPAVENVAIPRSVLELSSRGRAHGPEEDTGGILSGLVPRAAPRAVDSQRVFRASSLVPVPNNHRASGGVIDDLRLRLVCDPYGSPFAFPSRSGDVSASTGLTERDRDGEKTSLSSDCDLGSRVRPRARSY